MSVAPLQGPRPVGHARPPGGHAKVIPSEWKIELPKQGAMDDRLFGGCRSIEVGYKKEAMVGEGTYGEVFKARDLVRGDMVALKKIRMDNEREGFPITAIREIKILSSLAGAEEQIDGHLMRNNIITLREIVRSASHKSNNEKGSIYMVFDYMEHDMTGLLQRMNLTGRRYTTPQLKCILKQLFYGLALLQQKKILHRDLKNSNLLLNNKGELKIADFGLARYLSKAGTQQGADGRDGGKMTNRVITVWYRPPELFLGSEHYGPEIDMWSAGCIMFELLTGKPLFPGKDEPGTLEEIFRLMGKPTEDNMPGCTSLQYYHTLNVNNPKYPSRSQLRTHLGNKINDSLAIDLLESLLVLDPKKRIDATTAAMHKWFYTDPAPCRPDQLPKFEESHEMNMKKRRHEAQAAQHAAQQQGRQQRQRTDGQYGGPPAQQQQQQAGYGYGGQQQQQGYPSHGGQHRQGPPPQQPPHMPPGPMGPGRGPAPAAGGPPGPGGRPFLAPPGVAVPVQGRVPGPFIAPPGVMPMPMAYGGMPPPQASGYQQGYPPHQQASRQHGGGQYGAGAPPAGAYRGPPQAQQGPPPHQHQQGPGAYPGARPGGGLQGTQPDWMGGRR